MATIHELAKKQQKINYHQVDLKNVYEEYKTTFHLSRQLNETKEVEKVLQRLIVNLEDIVKFSAMGLMLKEEYSNDFYLQYELNLNDELKKRIHWLERSGYLEWVSQEDRVSIVPDESRENLGSSIILVPLISGKNGLGVLVIFLNAYSNKLTSRQTDLLSLLGTQAAVALENAYLYRNMALKNQAMSSMKNFLENSLESMTDGLFAFDLENKISLFNSSAANLFGIAPVEAIGNEIYRLFPSEFTKFLDHALDMAYTVGKFEGEYIYQHPKNGKQFPILIQLSILKNTNHEQIGAIATCRDISERQELIHLRKLDQLKDEFISSVSHELRTPLTGIKSFTEILLNYGDQDKTSQKEFLKIIDNETNRLIEIINDLLDLNHMDQGDFSIKTDVVNIQQVFEESMNSMKILSDSKSIRIVTDFDENHLDVKTDSKRLIQVFVNLISNAIKFSPEESEIRISSKLLTGKRLLDEGDYTMISVSDDGMGIPAKFHKSIFEKFKQHSYDPNTKPEGSGLGLPICKKIVEKLGGNIWVESEENKGSTFFFTLPLADKQH